MVTQRTSVWDDNDSVVLWCGQGVLSTYTTGEETWCRQIHHGLSVAIFPMYFGLCTTTKQVS